MNTCRERQDHFVDALLGGLALLPADGAWTVGDLIFLKAVLDEMTDDVDLSDLTLPIREAIARQ
jgi:hypothetical protein